LNGRAEFVKHVYEAARIETRINVDVVNMSTAVGELELSAAGIIIITQKNGCAHHLSDRCLVFRRQSVQEA
jgi:hypothetical protein